MLQDLFPLLLFGTGFLVVWVAVSRSARRHQRQRLQAIRADAEALGWSCESGSEGPVELTRWQGTTDGVSWTAEYRRLRRKRKRQTRTHHMRWWADGFGGPGAPLLLMGVGQGQEKPQVALAQGDGLLASMAQKVAGFALDKALDVHFGAEAGQRVDARTLQVVDTVEAPGFIVMATDAVQGAFWLQQAGPGAVVDAQVRDATSPFADEAHRPWVLWLGPRVYLSRMAPVNAVGELEHLVRAGVALVRATGG